MVGLMKSKPNPEFDAFTRTVDRLLAVPREELVIIHAAGSHLLSPSGESSKIVPTFTLN
jgi:hypothetical protein